MSSPNLAAPHVAAAQNQKEVTINDATSALDNAMNRVLSLAMGNANLTLTATQANRHGLIVLTGAHTAVRTVTLPANHRRLAVRNATSGGHAIRVKYAGTGAEVLVAPGDTVLVQGDGSNLFGVGGGPPGLADAPANGSLYGRRDGAWAEVQNVTVEVVEEPPAQPAPGVFYVIPQT